MKRILDIGHTDLRLFLKHKSAYIWLFGIPLAFVYFMGFANRGPGDPANPKPELAIENQDTQFLGRVFLDELDAQGMRLLSPTNSASSARAIRIPADFTALYSSANRHASFSPGTKTPRNPTRPLSSFGSFEGWSP